MNLKRLGILLLIVALTAGSVGCRNGKRAEGVTPNDETVNKEETEDKEVGNQKEENKEVVKQKKATDEEGVVSDEVDTDNVEKPDTATKSSTASTANKTDTTNRVTSSKPSSNQTVTEPKPSHVHSWTEVKTEVVVPETGHYEKVAGWVKFCTVCNVNMDDWTNEEINAHTFGDECPGKFDMDYKNIGEKWVVDTPATTELRVTGYKCSCGATREKTQYSGMYSKYDKASWDRLEACKQFFREGLVGEGSDLEHWAAYGYWESVIVSNGSTDGAWMWIFIRDWKLDDYSYLQDSVKEGIIDQEEAKLVEAVYEEIPSIFKGAIERVAPEGGTELYNYVEKLIIQTGGDPDAVPNLSGAKGTIPENIPGLYVTIEETRGGFSLMFWAE